MAQLTNYEAEVLLSKLNTGIISKSKEIQNAFEQLKEYIHRQNKTACGKYMKEQIAWCSLHKNKDVKDIFLDIFGNIPKSDWNKEITSIRKAYDFYTCPNMNIRSIGEHDMRIIEKNLNSWWPNNSLISFHAGLGMIKVIITRKPKSFSYTMYFNRMKNCELCEADMKLFLELIYSFEKENKELNSAVEKYLQSCDREHIRLQTLLQNNTELISN